MDNELLSAATPRWRGQPGRSEVWYATMSDPVTRAALWIHHETVAPTADSGRSPYRHGWVTWFPSEGPPRTERFGPEEIASTAPDAAWFGTANVTAGYEAWHGHTPGLEWDVRWKDRGAPLWTFPRIAWERELLPGAQVVVAPTAEFAGSLTVGSEVQSLDGWRGAVAHIYGRGNAKRWGWIHADLGHSDVLEVVSAVSHRPVLQRLPPMAFLKLRIAGQDWPAGPVPPLRVHTTLGVQHWQLEGRIGTRKVLIRVDQPPERCVNLGYTDPDGTVAVCTNTEQADIHVEIGDRRWSVLGTGHAEVGLRGTHAPILNERTPS